MTEVRADMVQVFICRLGSGGVSLLQLRRARDPALGTWQPVMGQIEESETAVECALRELVEETGLSSADLRGLWALEQAPPFYMHSRDAVIVAPRFCVLVDSGWRPTLNDEHDAHRWVEASDAARFFVWPTQVASIREITPRLLRGELPASSILRVL